MAHPRKAELEAFQYAIDHLPPTIPDSVKEEAQQQHDALAANAQATKEEIRDAMFETGRAEYPHRHAYRELTEQARGEILQKLVLEHLEDDVREKVEPHLASGVGLKEYVESAMFEETLTGEERYQVEHGILHARDHIEEELAPLIEEKRDEYAALVDKWDAHAQKILGKITELEALKSEDAKWRDEIENKVARLKEGFLVVETDPELETVEKEIEYWEGVLGLDEDEVPAEES